MTEIGLVLLASDDPVTIQQFSHALKNCPFRPMCVGKCPRPSAY